MGNSPENQYHSGSVEFQSKSAPVFSRVKTMSDSSSPAATQRHIATWLLIVCAMIYVMVVLGGVTRLTHSGLSMVNWHPIAGIIPPMSDSQWQAEFDNYKHYPEYQKLNQGMDLAGFKSIFWFEFAHRLLGRSIGLVFLLGFLWFAIRRQLNRELWPQLAAMFVLGGMQGLLGWFMVKSGLVDRPHVSQYRLTAHLSLAIAIYGYILWVALGLLIPKREYAPASELPRLRKTSIALWVLICVMIISGGFVAGTHAGFVYNTFPTMNGFWFPPGLYGASPWYHNFFDDLTTVQFNHRIIAYTIFVSVIAFVLWARSLNLPKPTMTAVYAVLAAMLLQVTLGISTLLSHVMVQVGAAHQGGALVLFTTVAVLVRLFHIPAK